MNGIEKLEIMSILHLWRKENKHMTLVSMFFKIQANGRRFTLLIRKKGRRKHKRACL